MDNGQIVTEFIACLCRLDFDAACAFVSDDVEYDNVPMGKNFGPEGLRELLEPMISGFDELDWVTHRQAATGNLVLNERTDRFRNGERWMEVPVAGVFEFNDEGKICLWRDYFDLGSMEDQLAKLG